jgi:hypothetical protein
MLCMVVLIWSSYMWLYLFGMGHMLLWWTQCFCLLSVICFSEYLWLVSTLWFAGVASMIGHTFVSTLLQMCGYHIYIYIYKEREAGMYHNLRMNMCSHDNRMNWTIHIPRTNSTHNMKPIQTMPHKHSCTSSPTPHPQTQNLKTRTCKLTKRYERK